MREGVQGFGFVKVQSINKEAYGLDGPPTCPVLVAIRDFNDYIRVLLYSYYTTITGWGGPPNLWLAQAS